jgi:carboxyl-terminal processing protease
LEALDAAQTANKVAGIDGSFGGIGVKLEKTNGRLRIERIIGAGPAERAGLKAGWTIASINGIPTASMELNDAVKLLRGPIGTALKLEAIPPDDPARLVSLIREKVLMSPVESRFLDGGVLLLRPGGFDKETPPVLRDILDQHAGAMGLVLDLRGSPGGLADAIAQVAGLFLPRNSTLWCFRDVSGRISERKSQGDPCTSLPLVVLANRQTSGGELLVSALQWNHRARVVGQPTSGSISATPVRELVRNADGTSRLEARGFNLLSRDASATNVAPDRILADFASDEDFFEAAREALSQPVKADAADRLKRVKALFDQGLISKEDYDKKVKEIVDAL